MFSHKTTIFSPFQPPFSPLLTTIFSPFNLNFSLKTDAYRPLKGKRGKRTEKSAMRSPTLRFAPPGLRPPKIACATGAERMPSRGYAPGHPAKSFAAKELQLLWSPTQPNAGTRALRASVRRIRRYVGSCEAPHGVLVLTK